MTQVLARKWRPRRFAELVGQEHVVRALTNALEQQRLHHAYLFTGTRGVGKTTLARIISKALNCESGVAAEPCGKCRTCVDIDAGRFVDLIELDAASNTQVDNMRELLENAMYAPTSGRYKVYIIDEVHMLSRNAFNAMLKTLEEPPAHVKFVLATTDPQKVPVTVLSRCLQFNLKQIPQQQIRDRLEFILREEGISFEAPALLLIARAAHGSLRDSLSLLDQAIAHGGGKVEDASTRAMLGSVDQSYLYTIVKALAAGDAQAAVNEADQMAARSLSFDVALQDLATLLHRLALIRQIPAMAPADDPDVATLVELAQLVDPATLQLYYQIAIQGRAEIGLAPDDYAGFTMSLLRMFAFAPGSGGDGAVEPSRSARAGARAGSAAPPTAVVSAAAPVSGKASPEPLAASAEPAPLKKNFEGLTWPDIIGQLSLAGMTRMLAQHCELVSIDSRMIVLRVGREHERLLEGPYRDRLQASLVRFLGGQGKAVIEIGEAGGNSPMAVADRDRQQKQAHAIAEIERDPFVRELVENFDARVNEATIKPLQ